MDPLDGWFVMIEGDRNALNRVYSGKQGRPFIYQGHPLLEHESPATQPSETLRARSFA